MSGGLLLGANMQTAEARGFKAYIGPVALSLRESGWTTAQIAREIGISPASASMYLWQEGGLRLPTAKDLMRRDGIGVQFRPDMGGKGERWEVEKMLRGRYRDDWEAALGTAKLSIRERVGRLRRERRHMRQLRLARQQRMRKLIRAEQCRRRQFERTMLAQERREERQREASQRRHRWREVEPQRVSFDAPLFDGSDSFGGRLIAAPASDPAVVYLEDEYRAERMADILGDLQVEDLARMDETHLEALRERLLEEGLVSIAVQRGERDRLRQPERHRGGGPGPSRTGMSTKRKHRKPGHQSSAGGSRGARKPRKRWDREAA